MTVRGWASVGVVAIAVLLLSGGLDEAVPQTLPGTPPASAIPEVAAGAQPLAQKDPALYRDEERGHAGENVWTLATRKIYPILPGALTLFVFSVLFSTINFYSELSEEQRSVRRTWKYLAAWTLTNYTFALILLLLILPGDVKLTSLTKQLAVYCLAVAALPELGSNIRLQLGKSDRALDLYRYKIQVSGLITRQMQRASHQDQSRDRECLENYYNDGFDALRQRLAAFVKQSDLSEDEQGLVLTQLKDAPATDSAALIDLVVARPAMMPQLLDFFREDIEQFRSSPVGTLLDDLQPRLTVREATGLVQNGITSRWGFLWRTSFAFQRRRLAAKTGIADERLRLLYYTTRGIGWRRRWTQLKAAIVVLLLAGLLISLLNLQADRGFVSYTPPSLEPPTPGVPQSGGSGVPAGVPPLSSPRGGSGR